MTKKLPKYLKNITKNKNLNYSNLAILKYYGWKTFAHSRRIFYNSNYVIKIVERDSEYDQNKSEVKFLQTRKYIDKWIKIHNKEYWLTAPQLYDWADNYSWLLEERVKGYTDGRMPFSDTDLYHAMRKSGIVLFDLVIFHTIKTNDFKRLGNIMYKQHTKEIVILDSGV